MAKKITDENGNTYVQKKPFYKRVWFWLLAIVVIFVLIGSLGGSTKKTTNSKNSNSHTTSSKQADKKNVSLNQFNNLKVGDLSNNGNGGTSYKDVETMFGKPSATTSSSIQGQTVQMDTWNNLGGDYTTLSLSFGGDGDNRSLSSKSITSAKNIISGTKISQSDYDAITTEGTMKVSDLVTKFGRPAIMTVYSIMNTETKTYIWSNVNSKLGSSVSLTVSGSDTIIGKSQSSN